MTCYNLSRDPEDDSTNINVPVLEGSCAIEGSNISSEQFIKPLNIKKVNIGSEDNPNLLTLDTIGMKRQ